MPNNTLFYLGCVYMYICVLYSLNKLSLNSCILEHLFIFSVGKLEFVRQGLVNIQGELL